MSVRFSGHSTTLFIFLNLDTVHILPIISLRWLTLLYTPSILIGSSLYISLKIYIHSKRKFRPTPLKIKKKCYNYFILKSSVKILFSKLGGRIYVMYTHMLSHTHFSCLTHTLVLKLLQPISAKPRSPVWCLSCFTCRICYASHFVCTHFSVFLGINLFYF